MEERTSPKGSLDFSRPWDFSDVVLLVEGKRFHVHRSILSMWSPMFSRMFTSDFKEKTAQVVPLPEKKSSEIKEMLLVIYPTSAKQIDGQNCYFLLNLAEEYMMEALTAKCEEYLLNCLRWPHQSPLLCLDLLGIAQDYGLNDLQMVCIHQASKISFWKLKDDSKYAKINFSNYQKIVEGMIERLELKSRDLEKELNAMQWKIRTLHTQIESQASGALKEFEKIASVLVQVVRDTHKDKYKGYISTESLDAKLRFISGAGESFSHLRSPLNNLRGELEAIKQSTSQAKNF